VLTSLWITLCPDEPKTTGPEQPEEGPGRSASIAIHARWLKETGHFRSLILHSGPDIVPTIFVIPSSYADGVHGSWY